MGSASLQANLVNTVMLVNYIKVFQQADLEVVIAQAGAVDNATGVGGFVPGGLTSGAVKRAGVDAILKAISVHMADWAASAKIMGSEPKRAIWFW